MRRAGLAFLLVLGLALAVAADGGFVAEGVSSGSTVIWFTPTTISTTFTGTMDFAGGFAISEQTASFTALGDSHGAGAADGMTFATDLWILFDAVGELESGEAITIRGGITIFSDQIDMATMSLGSGPGTFFAVVDVQTASHWISGTIESAASGSPVPPDDPSTMQVDGGATFSFAGAAIPQDGVLEEALPWDVSNWPEDLHAELLALLAGVAAEAEEAEE